MKNPELLRSMGHSESKDRKLFIDVLMHTLNKRCKSHQWAIGQIFTFCAEMLPLVPRTAVNLQTWTRVGNHMKEFHPSYGPEKMPVDAFALWTLVRDVLDPQQKAEKMPNKEDLVPGERTPLLSPAGHR